MEKYTIQIATTLALLASSIAHAQDAVQWKVSDGGNGHWYQLELSPMGWSVARSAALAKGGDLASLESDLELSWVRTTIPGHPWPSEGCHLGGFQAPSSPSPDAGWSWLTGGQVAIQITLDFDDNPCGQGCCGENNEQNFLHSYEYWQKLGDANEIAFSSSCPGYTTAYASLIEWSADCNSDGIVDYGQCHDGSLADINGNNIPDCCEAGADCAVASSGIGQCVVFARGTDTVHITDANTMLQGDYTIEWSGYLLNQAVVTNPPATVNARIWSEQDSVTEDKAVGINPNQTPWGWVNSPCYLSIQSPASLPVVTRAHVALVRLGGMVTMFVNGSAVSTAPQLCDPLNGGGSNMSLGAFVYVGQPSSNYWRAAPIALDWIRISGTSRYTSTFVPPQEPLVTDSSTQLLINFNGPNTWRDLANPGATLTPGSGVAGGTVPALATDCNSNGIPDQAELGMPGADLDGNGILDVCEQPTCHGADLYPNGRIDGADLGILLSEWGPLTPTTHSDINHDGMVNGADLGILLAYWGSCPN